MCNSAVKLLYLESRSLKIPNKPNCIDFSKYYCQNVDLFQSNTRGWIITKVEKWIQEFGHKNMVLWLNINPGMDKSVITAMVVNTYIKHGVLCAWHFCTHNNLSQNTILAILISLSGILEVNMHGYVDKLHSQNTAVLEEAKSNRDAMELFIVLLVITLLLVDLPTDLNDHPVNKLIIFEAVDEMVSKYTSRIFQILRDCNTKISPWLLIFVTSRQNDNILKILSAKVSCGYAFIVNIIIPHTRKIKNYSI